MKFLNSTLLLFALGGMWLFTSCASESPWGPQDNSSLGKIELTLLTDAGVSVGTRANESDNLAMAPDKSLFSISLLSRDGSIDKTWDSIEKFNQEEGFPMGEYTLSASYGNSEVEGFDKPFYYGEENIEVMLGHTTVQTITATLANSMLSVRYTDDLTSRFKAYSSAVQTEGNDLFAFAQNEDRAAYLNPGKAKFFVTLTNDKDKTVTVNLVDLKLEPKHHYIVEVGVNTDNLGNAVLEVNVTEDIITEEPVKIVLTDEFFSAPVPVVTAVGFDPENSINFFEELPEGFEEAQIHVMALAGMKSAKLTLTAENAILPEWGSNKVEIELIGVEQSERNKLENSHIKCNGFFVNAADFGFIDFTEYVKNLTPGSYKAFLTITDKLGRTADVNIPRVELKANVSEVKYEISGFINPELLSKEIILAVSTNCNKIKEVFKFEANDEDGNIVEVKAQALDEANIPNLTSTYDNVYYYKLITDPINDNQWTVKVDYGTKELTKVLDVVLPEIEAETDAFAKRVKVKIKAANEELTKQLANIINVKNNGNLIKSENIDRSKSSEGLIIIKGLNSKNQIVDGQAFSGVYDSMTLFIGKKTSRSDYKGTPIPFITEEALDVPNGEFLDTSSSINVPKLNIGGKFNVTFIKSVDYQAVSSIELNEPLDWANLNKLTCYNTSSATPNSWFYVPSTYSSNGICTIRTVGYNHNGNVPATYKGSYGNNNTYACLNSPQETDLLIQTGEIFLGSYSYDGSEHRKEGIDFKSRPLGLNLRYTYMPVNEDEEGLVNIILKNSKSEIISTLTYNLRATSEWKINDSELANPSQNDEITISLDEIAFGEKASTIEMSIKSSSVSDPNIYIPRNNELLEGITSLGTSGISSSLVEIKRDANTYKAFAKGSVLKISNMHFIYE